MITEREPEMTEATAATAGDLIRQAREQAGLSQRELGECLGVTQTCISYWEAGKNDLGIGDLARVATALDTSVLALIPLAAAASAGPADVPPPGEFRCIAFFGHIEHTGFVTEVTRHGQPRYHVDLPEKLWGGNPMAWVEYAASAWFSERPVSEESVRTQWEAEVRRAAERKRLQEEWDRRATARALPAAADDESTGHSDDEYLFEREPF